MAARAIIATILLGASLAHGAEPVAIEGGRFRTVLPPVEDVAEAVVADFRMDAVPVTNGEFLAFVTRHPEWRRGHVAPLFADENYLAHWSGPLSLGDNARSTQPVTNVSWFAARAFCEARGGRLPQWYEWEYVAAADESERDARHKPEWRQAMLAWYAETGKPLADVGSGVANAWGVHDLHGLVWEWVEDYNALLVSGDNREQGGADRLEFCGAGAITMEEKENYAVLMRVAMLSSLDGNSTTRNTGFRCAYDAAGDNK